VNLLQLESDTCALQLNAAEMADELLVSAARSGDSCAFAELSRRHSQRLLHRAYRITDDWQDAEDVVQESLMKAFTHLNTFGSRARFSTWLTRIAINSALMLLRKKRRSRTITIDSSISGEGLGEKFELPDHRDDPEQHYAKRQTGDRLRRAIQRMPPKYREVVELHQISDLSLNEIARSLHVSNATVKSWLFRARNQLRRYVQ
jgi:RNA polymerase sigma-70 factor (ECF subfamily)